jgi:RNA polymerase sigma factor (sigma-70 family)
MVGQLDVGLVAAARAGDQRALDELLAQFLPLVYNIAGRALGQRADVDDVVQDTMLRVVRGLGGLRDPQRFRSWLVAVTMNQVREHRQTRRAAPFPLDETPELADPGAEFVELTLTRLGLSGQRREVAQATRWLDADDRDLLSLWWLEAAGHLTRSDLIAAMELKAHHVTVRVARMKEQLEVSRLIVRALTTVPPCPQLAEAAATWPRQPTPLWRKRFARHIRQCGYCPDTAAEFIPAERLLAGLSLIPLPAGYASYMISGIPGSARAGSTGRAARHRASPHGLRRLPAKLFARPLLGLGAVTATAGIALTAIYLPVPGTLTAAGPPPVSVTTSAPAPIRTTASPTPTPTITPTTPAPPPPTATTSATAKPSPPAVVQAPATANGPQSPADQVLALINQTRKAAGLPAYTLSSGLGTSSTAHNQLMAGGCGLSHQCPGEASLGDRETAAGVQWTSAGENIGEGGAVSDTDSAIAQMAVGLTQDMINEQPPDDGHRLNILSSSYHHIGIAVYRDASGTVWMTQDFSN